MYSFFFFLFFSLFSKWLGGHHLKLLKIGSFFEWDVFMHESQEYKWYNSKSLFMMMMISTDISLSSTPSWSQNHLSIIKTLNSYLTSITPHPSPTGWNSSSLKNCHTDWVTLSSVCTGPPNIPHWKVSFTLKQRYRDNF